MGPLNGYTIIELAGIGPGADGRDDAGGHGGRGDPHRPRRDGCGPVATRARQRSRQEVRGLNLKDAQGVETLLRMVENADVLIDPFRPGVCEKLGIGPTVPGAQSALVFARMTGWGQDGPLAQAAGHDINYIALTGALFANGERDGRPLPPLNLVGDMGGGGMLLVNGILAALLETASSGQGQVIDVAMVDGAAQLMWMMHSFTPWAWERGQREANMLDGGAHFYNTYECADGEYVALGSIEPQFYALLRKRPACRRGVRRAEQPGALAGERERLAEVMRSKTRDEWCELLEGTDVCFAPVLRFTEAPAACGGAWRASSYIEVDGVCSRRRRRASRTPARGRKQ
jgi:alpha-methylacyl-CoA racemase